MPSEYRKLLEPTLVEFDCGDADSREYLQTSLDYVVKKVEKQFGPQITADGTRAAAALIGFVIGTVEHANDPNKLRHMVENGLQGGNQGSR